MALTDIARKLVEIFPELRASGREETVQQFKDRYGAAESIRIGGMVYIVINGVYKVDDDRNGVTSSASQLFYNSTRNDYAVIDAETSAILIDEVYSRVTYMQRDCVTETLPAEGEVQAILKNLVGEAETIQRADVRQEDDEEESSNNLVSIYQCQLIKDTGVSASRDVYSFMMKGGQIKEVTDKALQMIQDVGSVKVLDEDNRDELERRKPAIQEAVFDKFINSDIDIQSISVKSIFEIKMKARNVDMWLVNDTNKRNSIYRTTYLLNTPNSSTGGRNAFDGLNSVIHICNCCSHDLVDIRDVNQIQRLHTNVDAYDEDATNWRLESRKDKSGKDKGDKDSLMDNIVHAVGCEDCLTQCPACKSWHFDYPKLIGSRIYSKLESSKLKLVPGRAFITGLINFDGINYCSCRENIEWVYDERSGGNGEHGVIPIGDMVFINSANEKIADSDGYLEYLKETLEHKKPDSALKEREIAKTCLNEYRNKLASRFHMKLTGVSIADKNKCKKCISCGGIYHGALSKGYCSVCTELLEDDQRMVTRADGVVFMLRGGKKQVINKYVVTRLGNLKKISSQQIHVDNPGTREATDATAEASGS